MRKNEKTDVYVVAYPNGVIVPITVIAVLPLNNGKMLKLMSDFIKVMVLLKNQM
ncbi:hypothetical protein [Arenibacter latericius]|uniref:hypothetical protein n=1 Tax=Arenibacter latericius TaxID=86104 RepID=UPI00041CF871|nr:hypothetical protein [Arenibacter latericius]MDX1365201.1 hypothetical protein [Arenibacter latericius]